MSFRSQRPMEKSEDCDNSIDHNHITNQFVQINSSEAVNRESSERREPVT